MIRLSIIYPVLNSHEVVRRQLLHFEKIGLNDLDDVELILVDDGSDPPIEAPNCPLKRLRILQTYQQAQYYWGGRTATGLEMTIGLFTEVVEADSAVAPAWVGLASAYTLIHYYGSLPPSESYPRAREAAERALELDEGRADAHAPLGLVKRDYDRDCEGGGHHHGNRFCHD